MSVHGGLCVRHQTPTAAEAMSGNSTDPHALHGIGSRCLGRIPSQLIACRDQVVPCGDGRVGECPRVRRLFSILKPTLHERRNSSAASERKER